MPRARPGRGNDRAPGGPVWRVRPAVRLPARRPGAQGEPAFRRCLPCRRPVGNAGRSSSSASRRGGRGGAGRVASRAPIIGGVSNATLGTRSRYDAPGQPRGRCRQIRRGLVPGQIRRHPCLVHRHGRGAGAAIPAQHRQGLGHRRIRHAAALDPHPHRPRGGARPAERAHPGDPAADRPQPARGRRSRQARRAPAPHRLRRIAGRWRHPHRRRHRQLCGIAPGVAAPGLGRSAAGAAARRQRGRGVVRASSPAVPSSTSITPRICRR